MTMPQDPRADACADARGAARVDTPHAARVDAQDHALLARALALAASVHVTTSPNPAVGCVITHDGVVVGEGATRPVGGAHAEVVALRAAGQRARQATAYVSLEPCAHHGRTPPCSDALLAAGVARVVVACRDPHPPAAGGAEVLAAAGVEVVGPEALGATLPAAAAAGLEGFLTVVRAGRPHVTLKLAQGIDGSLVAPVGQRWVTGPAARRAVHRWRARVDAVLVGSGTVLADDPRLDVRDAPVVLPPRAVVVDSRLVTPPDARVVRSGTIVLTGDAGATPTRRALEVAGVEVIAVATDARGRVVLDAALAALAARGITSVLAEPGPRLARALLDADLVDRMVVHLAASMGSGTPAWAVPVPAWRDTPARPTTPGAPDGAAGAGSAVAGSEGAASAVVGLLAVPDGWRLERCGGAGIDVVRHLIRDRGDAGYRDADVEVGRAGP